MDLKEARKYKVAHVEVVSNGFIIRVGCTTVVAKSPDEVILFAQQYYGDPEKFERELYSEMHLCQDIPFSSTEGRVSGEATTAKHR